MLAVAEKPLALDVDAIRARWDRLGLTMEQAGVLAGFKEAHARQQWYMIESGRRLNLTIETINQVAKALNCPAKSLLRE